MPSTPRTRNPIEFAEKAFNFFTANIYNFLEKKIRVTIFIGEIFSLRELRLLYMEVFMKKKKKIKKKGGEFIKIKLGKMKS